MIQNFWQMLCRWPYRFLAAAALLALLLCLFPVRVDAPGQPQGAELADAPSPSPQGVAAGADLSERTGSACLLHRTLYYAPCGHSVQRREELPAALTGLTRTALAAQLETALPGAQLTGFSAREVDVSQELSIPCPLHWVLCTGADGCLTVLQNLTGEALSAVRTTELRAATLPDEAQEELFTGMVFDDVQTLEGYLESLSS